MMTSGMFPHYKNHLPLHSPSTCFSLLSLSNQMGSVFPDLNLFPPTKPAIEQPSTLLITPKLEPNTEPIETQYPINVHRPQNPNPHSYYLGFENPTLFPQSIPSSAISQPIPEFQNNNFSAPTENPNPDGSDIPNSQISQTLHGFENSTVLPQERPDLDFSNIPNSQIPEPVSDLQNQISMDMNVSQRNTNSRENASDGEAHDSESMALVLAPQQDDQLAVAPFKFPPRSNELVRVTDLSLKDRAYYREFVRKTRLVYDSLRVFADELKRKKGLGMGARGDLRAASEMKGRRLWLFRDRRIVGAIPGIEVGDLFFFRMELCVFGLHGHSQAGIDYLSGSMSSNGEPIATSIVVSGGYEDDDDQGDVLIYTGQGGQDKNAKNKQVVSQQLARGNLALERSMTYGIEVRVIRGVRYPGSPNGKVYVYDGLYKITQAWFDEGKSGLGVYKFKLVRVEGQPEMGSAVMRYAANLKINPLSVRPVGYVSLDMSLKKEKMPILFYNDVDQDYSPMYHEYIGTTLFPPYAYQGRHGGCGCVSGCTDGCLCAKKNGDEFPYDSNGLLMRGKPLVFECGINCQCPPSCRNRVCQNGIKYRLEVFRSEETQWGVRSLDLIQAGSFICEFAGLALTRDQAQIVDLSGDSLVYPSRFATRWTEWGDLSAIFTDYVTPSYPSVPPLDFALDVSKVRNVACYISHNSSPNLFVQFVLYDHNSLLFPHVMLFAMENIPPMRELSLDYGVADESTTGKLLICN